MASNCLRMLCTKMWLIFCRVIPKTEMAIFLFAMSSCWIELKRWHLSCKLEPPDSVASLSVECFVWCPLVCARQSLPAFAVRVSPLDFGLSCDDAAQSRPSSALSTKTHSHSWIDSQMSLHATKKRQSRRMEQTSPRSRPIFFTL